MALGAQTPAFEKEGYKIEGPPAEISKLIQHLRKIMSNPRNSYSFLFLNTNVSDQLLLEI